MKWRVGTENSSVGPDPGRHGSGDAMAESPTVGRPRALRGPPCRSGHASSGWWKPSWTGSRRGWPIPGPHGSGCGGRPSCRLYGYLVLWATGAKSGGATTRRPRGWLASS